MEPQKAVGYRFSNPLSFFCADNDRRRRKTWMRAGLNTLPCGPNSSAIGPWATGVIWFLGAGVVGWGRGAGGNWVIGPVAGANGEVGQNFQHNFAGAQSNSWATLGSFRSVFYDRNSPMCQLRYQQGHTASYCPPFTTEFPIITAPLLHEADPTNRNLDWHIDPGAAHHMIIDFSNWRMTWCPTGRWGSSTFRPARLRRIDDQASEEQREHHGNL